jgi:uncharacterized protein involved in type VI secretion and phage assembly
MQQSQDAPIEPAKSVFCSFTGAETPSLLSCESALTVHSPTIPQRAGRPAWVPRQLSSFEAINALFEYRLVLQTSDSLLALGGCLAKSQRQPNAGADKAANRTEPQGQHLARLRMQALRQGGHTSSTLPARK